MAEIKVVLIGGAPGVGKTTLGRALAAKVDATSLSADDLLIAAKAVTTAQSHPGLHVMSARATSEYFTTTSVDQLNADATAQHEALWPAIEQVIRHHATWGAPIVMDGWFLGPRRVSELDLPNVMSLWLVADPGVLEERERENADFFRGSHDPERMLQNFLGRSLWHNDLVRRQATECRLPILQQDGHASVSDLCAMALRRYQEMT